ncbi:glycolipid transfer protein domain-containing protein 2 isoform 1-T2 [Clarias gariepinus]|uniref:glycolipid transfer protein domain-containing protein 2 n=1 Tax=Clarias gariepinus TaxID=13013 RepID=UPI00234DE043|nr:glycolipid transfer protein domain-containing protein 2 [Clarias gariepinus]XP_053340867.1 glycolipid transfer protein domain-containing protein 2 [Clarias gariepinus]
MGVKGRAALAIIFIVILLFTIWLYGNLDHCWDYCLKNSIKKDQAISLQGNNTTVQDVKSPLKMCPGQKFQVSYLMMHLQAAPVSTDDVLLEPYLASWDELIKFMDTLGPMVGVISQEIEAKTSIIRKLAKKEKEETQLANGSASHGAYDSVRSMITSELEQGLVDFHQFTESGCRTLLRLHRALLWLQLFLHNLADERKDMMGRSPSELCREAYRGTLARHHSWWVRQAAELAFIAMPERQFFYKLMCVKTQTEAAALLNRVVNAIHKVYNRTQEALQEHSMLSLP